MEGGPELENLVGAETKHLQENTGHDGDESEGENVVDKVLVPKFYILEFDGVGEVRQNWRHFVLFV